MALPLNLQLQFNQAEHRRRIADALVQQALTPIRTQSSGAYVTPISPLQGLAKIAQAYAGSRMGNRINDQEQGLVTGYQNKQLGALDRLATAYGLHQNVTAPQSEPATQPDVQTFPLSSAPASKPLMMSGTGGAETMASEPPGPLSPASADSARLLQESRSNIASAMNPRQRAYNAELQYIKDSGDTSLIPAIFKQITAPPTLHSLAQGATLYDQNGNVIATSPGKDIQVDRGNEVDFLDPVSHKVVASLPKGVSPSARYFENGAMTRELARQKAEDARLQKQEQFRLRHPTGRPNFSAQHFNAQIDSASTYIQTHPEPKDPFDPARMFWLRQQALANTPKLGTSAAPTASAPSATAGESPQGGSEDMLGKARDAIANGAPRAEVEQRLKQMGIDPSGL